MKLQNYFTKEMQQMVALALFLLERIKNIETNEVRKAKNAKKSLNNVPEFHRGKTKCSGSA